MQNYKIRMNKYDRHWAAWHAGLMSIFVVTCLACLGMSMFLPLFEINQWIGIIPGILFGLGAMSNLHAIMTKYKLQALLERMYNISISTSEQNVTDICNNSFDMLDAEIVQINDKK